MRYGDLFATAVRRGLAPRDARDWAVTEFDRMRGRGS